MLCRMQNCILYCRLCGLNTKAGIMIPHPKTGVYYHKKCIKEHISDYDNVWNPRPKPHQSVCHGCRNTFGNSKKQYITKKNEIYHEKCFMDKIYNQNT